MKRWHQGPEHPEAFERSRWALLRLVGVLAGIARNDVGAAVDKTTTPDDQDPHPSAQDIGSGQSTNVDPAA